MRQNRKSKILGITGGVGSGKSEVLSYLEEQYQAVAFYADLIAHDLQEPGECCYRDIVKVFGTGILLPDEHIDRKALSGIVYEDRDKLQQLNEIVHPAVREWILHMFGILDGKAPFFAVEAALLLEAGYDQFCDETWYIYADESVRRSRLEKSRHYSQKRISEIMENQLTEEKFRAGCGRVIDNSGAFSRTKEQIDEILASSSDLW